jgi:hypothetical protein
MGKLEYFEIADSDSIRWHSKLSDKPDTITQKLETVEVRMR